MIAIALILAAAAPESAVDAERVFAAMAQTDGMWTAFRAKASDDALMFVPQPTNAQEWLKGRDDPAMAYMWWPAAAYVSCDGKVAATTGPSIYGRQPRYFTTIWTQQASGGWKWVLDHGDKLASPRPAGETPKVRKAACSSPAKVSNALAVGADSAKLDYRAAASRDGSLRWSWQVDRDSGARNVKVELWNGTAFETVIDDNVTRSE